MSRTVLIEANGPGLRTVEPFGGIPAPPRPWRPWHGEIRELPDSLKGPAAEHARELYADILARRTHLRTCGETHREAQDAVLAARQALAEEQARAAQEGTVSNLDTQLLAKLNAAEAQANPAIHDQRRYAAEAQIKAAEDRYLAFVHSHAGIELLDELTPDAESVAKSYRETVARHAEELAPIIETHAKLREAVVFIAGGRHEFRPDCLPEPNDLTRAPLPDAESIARARNKA